MSQRKPAPTFASHYTFTGPDLPGPDLPGPDLPGPDLPGLDLPDLLGTGYFWDLSAFTTNGTLAIVLVPEPSRLPLLAMALTAFGLRRRR